MEAQSRLSTTRGEVDRGRVHSWLSEQSYWARGRIREAQDAAVDASRNDSEGVGKILVRAVVEDLDALGVRRTLLSTRDAHGRYTLPGSSPLEPGRWMGRGRL